MTLLLIDKSNVLWIGTRGGGLNWYNASKGEFIAYKNIHDDSLSVFCLTVICYP